MTQPQKTAHERGMRHVSFELPEEQWQALQERAALEDRAVSRVVRRALRKYLNETAA